MDSIPRHVVDAELVQEGLEREQAALQSLLDAEVTDAYTLADLVSVATAAAGYLAASGAATSEVCRAMRVGAQSAAGLFSLASGLGDVDLAIADRRLRLPATGPTDATHVGRWRTGWWLATIVGDEHCIDRLAEVPVEVLRASSTQADDCQYLFAEALQLYDRRTAGWADKLQAALEATDPEPRELIDEAYVLNILVPEMQLVFQHAVGDVAPFEQAFEFALTRHQNYWSTPERFRDPDGFIALGPTALAVMGRAAGYPIHGVSDYAPRELLDGACRSR